MQCTPIVALLVLFALPAAAQQSQPIELGGDAALSFQLDAPTSTLLSLPLQQVRVGFGVAPNWEIEPMLGFTYFSTSGGSNSAVTVGVGALYHFMKYPSGSQVYVRPFLQTTHFSTSGGGGSSSTSVGAGLGIKVPIVSRLAARYEAALATSSSSTRLMLLAGLSFFTH